MKFYTKSPKFSHDSTLSIFIFVTQKLFNSHWFQIPVDCYAHNAHHKIHHKTSMCVPIFFQDFNFHQVTEKHLRSLISINPKFFLKK